uniref:Integrase catalytic domain-containing protein n=1 Tax=Tanacetum cinerariifolium TaxID=118510 RepID=A0A699IRE1_TANCI|nr:hypothetical protein [Tanacetum cinerariifolium]
MNVVVHDNVKSACLNADVCAHCVTIEFELKKDFIKKECYETLLKKLFEINDLKAQPQAKDTVIVKLKEKLHSLNGDMNERNVKREVEEIETLNIELDYKVTKLVAENKHLKQTYKQLYDSIKSSRVRSKEQCDDLINKVNLKSAEVSDLNASLQEKVLVDVAPLVPKLRKNRTAHTDYIRHTKEEAATLREIVESERLLSLLNTSLDYVCKYTRRIQELLMILQQTCPCLTVLGTKLVAVTPKNKTKQIRLTDQITKLRKTTVTTPPSANIDSNTHVLSSTGVTLVFSASGSMSQDNTKKNRIQRTQRKAKKNKIEDHLRTVKSSLNKKSVVDSKATSSVINSVSNMNSDLKCASCNGCLFFDNHDACVVAYIKSVNARIKSKSVKSPVKRKVWQPTGNVFKTVGHIWKPTGRTFTLVGNVCPLIRIATPTIVPHMEPILIVNSTDKPIVTLVYSRKTKAANKKVPNKMEPNNSWGSSSSNVPSSLIACRNDHVAKIMGYGDYQIGNVTISQVYYVEGLGQFCDSDLEVAFRQHTCFIRNLDRVNLLTGSQGNNMYTLSLQDMMASSPICLLSKASKTKSWFWHRRLSHLNFGAINHLARSKDETPDFIIKFLKMIQVRLKVLVCRIRTDNGTEFFNQTLRDYYEEVGISHETSVARSPQQNGVVERRNRTLIEAARTIENLGKLQPKADIRIFIGYAPTKKAFRIYNRRTRRIVETIHVDFDELTAMASEQSSSGPVLNEMTPGTISLGLMQTSSPSTSYVPPSRNDWDLLLQPMFDELLNPPPSVVNQAPKVIAPIAEVIPLVHANSTGSPSSTTVDQDAPSSSKTHTTTEIQSSVIPHDVGDDNLDIEVAHMGNDPLFGVPILEVTSA